MSLEPFTTLIAATQRARLNHAEASQRALLTNILRRSAGTPVGRALDLDGRLSFDDFLRVAPRDFGFYSPYVQRALDGDLNSFSREPVVALAETSGSLGQPKLIPHTERSLQNFERFTRRVLLFQLKEGAHYFPHLTKWLLVTASTAVHRERGIPVGFISGLMYQRARRKRRDFVLPSPGVAGIEDWQLRMREAVAEAKGEKVGTLLGVPAYLVRFLHEAARQFGATVLPSAWPVLQRVYYSGTSIDPYRDQIEAALGRPVLFRGLYTATEGAFAAELDGQAPGALRLMTDLAVFTFRDQANGSALRAAWQLEVGHRYEIFVTTVAGLIQYAIGDVLEVTATRPLKFRVAGRVGEELNLATEKLSLKQALQVMSRLASKLPVNSERFMVLPDRADSRRHLWLIESSNQADNGAAAETIDRELGAINPSYAALRRGDALLCAPRVVLLAPGAFDAYVLAGLTTRGQFKFRHVLPDPRVLQELPGMLDIAERIAAQ